jgi:4-hydroxybutyrate CoA-transferase
MTPEGTRVPDHRSAADAVAKIGPGMTVFVGSMSAEPLSLTSALWERSDELSNVTILTGTMLTGYPFLRADDGSAFKLRTWFMPGTLTGVDVSETTPDFLPMSWAQTMRYLVSTPIDIALIQVSPADKDGFHSFGISASNTRAAVRVAQTVIAEVNEEMPRTCGDSLVHESEFDVVVAADHQLPEFPHRLGDAVDDKIGELAAAQVPNGSTLQYGIGTIPASVLKGLVTLERRDLRLISQLTDPARSLIESGACVHEGPQAVVGEILGTRDLYRWVHGNPAVSMADAFHTHTAEALGRTPQFVSVNSALEVDLYGQVNSEVMRGRQSGGIGGSMDFALGAQFEGARSIIALRSTARGGQSRIVANLMSSVVTIPRTLVQIVVTEHGVADLRSMAARERAAALAAIAAPEHRDELLMSARQLL